MSTDIDDVLGPTIGMVLARRHSDAAFRSEVGRACIEATEVYAYRHLAWAWVGRPWLRVPILRVGAAACTYRGIPQHDRRSLGALAALVSGGQAALARNGVDTRLLAASRMPLDRALRLWRPVLTVADAGHVGLDWFDFARLAVGWDHPDRARRESTRRSLLDSFYSARTPKPEPDATLDDPIQETA